MELQRYPLSDTSQDQLQQSMLSPNMVGQSGSQTPTPTPPGHGKAQNDLGELGLKEGFKKLQELDGIFIHQKFELLEAVSGFETQNTYYVYALGQDGKKKGHKLFKCKEKSSCCARQCMRGDCRAFQMDISYLAGEGEDEYEPLLWLERPFKCTCFCLARPEILVQTVEGKKREFIGKIVDPWSFCGCNMEFNIYDKENTKQYSIEGSCCQMGLWCKFPCKSCKIVDFNVKSASGEVVSSMQKQSQGCCRSSISDADNFVLHFPKNATLSEKILLMSGVLFIDYRHFENGSNLAIDKNKNDNHNHYQKN